MKSKSKSILAISAAALGIVAANPAFAVTYVGSHAVGAGSIDLSITTDNTIGILASGNITGWTFALTNPGGSIALDPTNSLLTIFQGTALSATATQLVFDFNGTGRIAWDNFGSGGRDGYCLDAVATVATCVGFPPSETVAVNNVFSTADRSNAGRFILGAIATSGVPEPATWAMMLLGFGLIGGAMRYRRRQKPKVRFAF